METGVERVDGHLNATKAESDVELEVAGNVVSAIRGRTNAPCAVEGIEGANRSKIDAGSGIKDCDGVRARDDARGADGDGLSDSVLELDAEICKVDSPMTHDAVCIGDGGGIVDVGVKASSVRRIVVSDGQGAVTFSSVLLKTLEAEGDESAARASVVPQAGKDSTGLWWTEVNVAVCCVACRIEIGLDETVGGRTEANDAGKVA